jgi:hypothetical protein
MIESEWVSMIQAMKDKGALSSFALKLYGAFGPTVFGRSVIPLCYAETVFDAILAGKNYDTILDIGTGNGIPAVYMAQYCKHVRTIDIVDNPMRKEVIKLFGMEDKIKFSKINSECEKEIRIETIAGGFDFCYMDGAHSETTYSDWMMVRQCGRVLFHEYYTDQKPYMI